MIFFTLLSVYNGEREFCKFADTTEYQQKNTRQGGSGMRMKTEKKTIRLLHFVLLRDSREERELKSIHAAIKCLLSAVQFGPVKKT